MVKTADTSEPAAGDDDLIVAIVAARAAGGRLSLIAALRLALKLKRMLERSSDSARSALQIWPPAGQAPVAEPSLVPVVAIADSIQDDYLICLETGARVKLLSRHLSQRLGLTPEEYRRKWKLPDDYPMTAPSYRAWRSAHGAKGH